MSANPVTSGRIVQLDSRQHTASDGDLVSLWVDQSGNGNNAASSGSARPTYKTGIINSKPAMRFADKGMLGNLTGWGTPTGMQICCLVTNFSASTGYGGLGSISPAGLNDYANSSSIILGGTTGAANKFGAGDSAANLYTFDVPNTSRLFFYSYGSSATGTALGIGNGQVKTTRVMTLGTAQARYSIGCRITGGAADNSVAVTADYCLYLVYNRVLSNAEFADLGEWALSEFAASSGGTSRPSLPFSQQVIG
jgi:hypothetical protein